MSLIEVRLIEAGRITFDPWLQDEPDDDSDTYNDEQTTEDEDK